MGTTPATPGTTFASDSAVGAVALSNPNNAAQDDGTSVTWVLLLGQLGFYLKATAHQFAIPLDSTITGVRVGVKKSSALSSMSDLSLRLVKGGTIQGNDKATATFWPTSAAFEYYGSDTDMWGLTLTPTEVNAADFGVVVAPTAALAATASVDYMTMEVSYLGSNRPGACGWWH